MGLDYDRLQFCPKDIQKKYFEMQLSLCSTLKLPMFLHCRNASDDFVRILRKHKEKLTPGVVHSFDGNPEDANSILQLGLYIGVNGWYGSVDRRRAPEKKTITDESALRFQLS